MITPVHHKAEFSIKSRNGHDSGDVTATRLAVAGRKSESPLNVSEPPDRATLDRAVAQVSEALNLANARVNLQVDQDTEQVVVKVLNESGEVIRQFPPKEVVELAKYLSEENTLSKEKGVLLEQQA